MYKQTRGANFFPQTRKEHSRKVYFIDVHLAIIMFERSCFKGMLSHHMANVPTKYTCD